MSIIAVIRAGRDAARGRALDLAWSDISTAINGSGLDVRRFGSSANGAARQHSDLDLMVMGCPDEEGRSFIEKIVADASRLHQVPVDLLYADHFSSRYLAAILFG